MIIHSQDECTEHAAAGSEVEVFPLTGQIGRLITANLTTANNTDSGLCQSYAQC